MLQEPRAFALCTVIEARGSTPRQPGARMIVRADATIIGTVGGGTGERDIILAAQDILANGTPRLIPVEMWADADAAEGMVCGGRMDVWIERLDPGPSHDGPWIRILAERHRKGETSVLLRRIAPSQRNATVDSPSGMPPGLLAVQDEADGPLWRDASVISTDPASDTSPAAEANHKDRVEPGRRLVIVGAGHIGLALARLAHTLEYEVTLVDDRPAAELTTVPGTEHCYGKDCGAVLSGGFAPGTDYALLSRGWRADVGALRAILQRTPGYVGMVGSQRRVETVFKVLESEGIDRAVLGTVDAPIGIEIGAETPEEIAVSIASALITYRRQS